MSKHIHIVMQKQVGRAPVWSPKESYHQGQGFWASCKASILAKPLKPDSSLSQDEIPRVPLTFKTLFHIWTPQPIYPNRYDPRRYFPTTYCCHKCDYKNTTIVKRLACIARQMKICVICELYEYISVLGICINTFLWKSLINNKVVVHI